jgi:hypothetical protein
MTSDHSVGQQEGSPATELLRLCVTADGDPSVLPRLLGLFQNLNVIPRAVLAQYATAGLLYLQIDVCGLTQERLDLLAAKTGQTPSVLHAYWHYL